MPHDDTMSINLPADATEASAEPVQVVVAKPVKRPRKKRVPPGGESRGRKLILPDDVHDRLWLLARQRRASVSSVAADILDKALPRFKVERVA